MSSTWAPSDSLYKTVNSLSANWNLGFNGYQTFAPLSAGFVSVYETVRDLSGNWYNEFTMYTNRVQQFTRSKTFSGTNLSFSTPPSSVDWNVELNQITFFQLTSSAFFKNAVNIKNGGTYALVLSTNRSELSAFFDSSYRLSNNLRNTRTMNLSGYTKIILDFVSDGTLMYGNPTYYIE